MLELRPSSSRGIANLSWLHSRHTFSFGSYYSPREQGFSDLLAINDDHIEPGMGFGTHPHKNMEIFTYVLKGALEHRDSMCTGSIIRSGDVQIMSAGSGISHSEFNASQKNPLHLIQVWIRPAQNDVTPRYQKKRFPIEEKRGHLRLILSPDGADGSLPIGQDVGVYAGLFDHNEHETLTLPENRHAFLHVARGSIIVNGQPFSAGDGARIRDEREITLHAGQDAEVLLFDLRPTGAQCRH